MTPVFNILFPILHPFPGFFRENLPIYIHRLDRSLGNPSGQGLSRNIASGRDAIVFFGQNNHTIYAVDEFVIEGGSGGYTTGMRSYYYDYNGGNLSQDILRDRDKSLRQDLKDIADIIREGLRGARADAFNKIRENVIAKDT